MNSKPSGVCFQTPSTGFLFEPRSLVKDVGRCSGDGSSAAAAACASSVSKTRSMAASRFENERLPVAVGSGKPRSVSGHADLSKPRHSQVATNPAIPADGRPVPSMNSGRKPIALSLGYPQETVGNCRRG